MTIAVGDRLPDATFRVMGADGIKPMTTHELFAGKKVVLFAVPGAFTPTCHLKHLPGFIERASEFKQHGVDTVVCVAVNDPFVSLGGGSRAARAVLFLSDEHASSQEDRHGFRQERSVIGTARALRGWSSGVVKV
jgi:peroxiredoxin